MVIWEMSMLRPWELNLTITRECSTAIHVQIANKIIEDIQNGRLSAGIALPGTRGLANKLNVNRKTVIQAYDELISQGWLATESKRGTFVTARVLTVNEQSQSAIANQATEFVDDLALSSNRYFNGLNRVEHDIRSMQNKRANSEFIHFSDGLPDSRLIPLEALSRAMRHALIVSARNNKLAYSDPKGAIILREAILQMLNMERGLNANTEQICITRGSQMGIWLLANVLIKQGDFVAVEKLSNPLARDAFKANGAHIMNIEVNAHGIDLDHLEVLCRLHPIKLLYVTPNCHIPTAVSMPHANRIRLLALAELYDFIVLEDDSEFPFGYSEKNSLPLASIQPSQRIIYIGSLSKVLAPGFRLGYIIASDLLIRQCVYRAMLIDRQGNTVTELAIAELLHTGEIKRQMLRSLKVYDERRAFISTLLQKELSDFVSFELPEKGLALWLNVDNQVRLNVFKKEAELQKVSVVLGNYYSHTQTEISAIRLGFANLNLDEIELGIKRLKQAFLNQTSYMLSA